MFNVVDPLPLIVLVVPPLASPTILACMVVYVPPLANINELKYTIPGVLAELQLTIDVLPVQSTLLKRLKVVRNTFCAPVYM